MDGGLDVVKGRWGVGVDHLDEIRAERGIAPVVLDCAIAGTDAVGGFVPS